ncbi:MAG: hypothetical protein RLZZ524_940 [Pseudomonadota bacterium]|jgi:hypothetical protein
MTRPPLPIWIALCVIVAPYVLIARLRWSLRRVLAR